MTDLRWSIDEEGRPSATGDTHVADEGGHERWAPGGPAEDNAAAGDAAAGADGDDGDGAAPPAWRPWAARILAATLALAAVALAVRVASNARTIGRVAGEVERVVLLERQALAEGDRAVWEGLQRDDRDSVARRRYRAGPAGPAPGLRAVPGAIPTVQITPDVDDARDAGGRIRRAEARLQLPFEDRMDQGWFEERQRWRRDDGAWQREARAEETRWPEAPPPEVLPEELREQLLALRVVDQEGLGRLSLGLLTVRFLPADAHHAAALLARVAPWLDALCAADAERACPAQTISLTLDTPGTGYAAGSGGMRLPAPSRTWAPADEAAMDLWARQAMRLLASGDGRTPSGMAAALIEAILAEVDAVEPPPTRAPGSDGPTAWTLWRWAGPSVDALGEGNLVRPELRAGAREDGVDHALLAHWAGHLLGRVGLGEAQSLLEQLERTGRGFLLDWLRPVLGSRALSVALAWAGGTTAWPDPPRTISCAEQGHQLLLQPGRPVPLDLSVAACGEREAAQDASMAPGGKAVAVACGSSGGRSAARRIVGLPLEDDGRPGRPVELAGQLGMACCLRWVEAEHASWLFWPVRSPSTSRSIPFRGVPVDVSTAGALAPPRLLGHWLEGPPEVGAVPTVPRWSPDGTRAALTVVGSVGPRVEMYVAPPLDEGARNTADPPLEPRWGQPSGVQPLWSDDGRRIAWAEPDLATGGSMTLVIADAADGRVLQRIVVDRALLGVDQDVGVAGFVDMVRWLGDTVTLVHQELDGPRDTVPERLGNGERVPLTIRLLAADTAAGSARVVEVLPTSLRADFGPSPWTQLMRLGPPELQRALFTWAGPDQLGEAGVVYVPEDADGGTSLPSASSSSPGRAFAVDARTGWSEADPGTVRRDDAGDWVIARDGLRLLEHGGGRERWALRGPGCLP